MEPPNCSTVSPYLIVTDAARTISFLEQVFGARLLRSFPDDSGRLVHAEVRIDNTVVMLADCTPEWPAMPSCVHVYVPDVDATFARALAAGAAAVQEPVQKGDEEGDEEGDAEGDAEGDEDKRGGVRDSGSTTWWIATRVG